MLSILSVSFLSSMTGLNELACLWQSFIDALSRSIDFLEPYTTACVRCFWLTDGDSIRMLLLRICKAILCCFVCLNRAPVCVGC